MRNGTQSVIQMRGVTIMELLVATAVGSVVIGSVLALYMNALESAAFLNSTSRVQESGRFATAHISRTMRMARYDDDQTTGAAAIVPALEGTTSSDNSLSMSPFTLKANTDAIKISHEGAPQVRDCQGVEIATDAWVTNTYAISSNNELICSNGTTTGIIAEGIEDMVLQYGIDNDADGVANRYVSENNVADWEDVVSAKVFLLVNSVETVFAATKRGSNVYDCKSCDTFNPTASSNLLHGEFHSTVQFRN